MGNYGHGDAEPLYESLNEIARAIPIAFTKCVGSFLSRKQWLCNDSCENKGEISFLNDSKEPAGQNLSSQSKAGSWPRFGVCRFDMAL